MSILNGALVGVILTVAHILKKVGGGVRGPQGHEGAPPIMGESLLRILPAVLKESHVTAAKRMGISLHDTGHGGNLAPPTLNCCSFWVWYVFWLGLLLGLPTG